MSIVNKKILLCSDNNQGGNNQGGGNQGGTAPPPNDANAPDTEPEANDDPAADAVSDPFINPFEDISADAWYYDYVGYAYINGLMTGTSTEPMLFAPQMTVTRGMIVTVLYRLAEKNRIEDEDGEDEGAGSNSQFADVPEGAWYYDAVTWAAANGIANGIGGGMFAPAASITRQDLATMLDNYASRMGIALPETAEYQGFLDEADIADYAKEAIGRLFAAGVISGRPGNVFGPQGEATRAELAAMLSRFADAMQ